MRRVASVDVSPALLVVFCEAQEVVCQIPKQKTSKKKVDKKSIFDKSMLTYHAYIPCIHTRLGTTPQTTSFFFFFQPDPGNNIPLKPSLATCTAPIACTNIECICYVALLVCSEFSVFIEATTRFSSNLPISHFTISHQ